MEPVMIEKNLLIFHTAAAVGSFTGAAALLGMTQPNVTQQLARLERKLNVPLFRRTGHSVELTPAGEVLEKECRHLFELESDILKKLHAASQNRRPYLIGGTPTAGSFLLIGLTVLFQKSCPDCMLNLKIKDFDSIKNELAAGELELALTEEPYDADYFFHEPYCMDRLVPVFAPGYAEKRFSLARYIRSGGKFILRKRGTGSRNAFSSFLKKHELPEPDAVSVTEVDSIDAVKMLAQAAFGIAVVSELEAENEIRTGVLQQGVFTEGEIVRNVDFIFLPDGDQRFIQDFIRFCRRHRGVSLGG